MFSLLMLGGDACLSSTAFSELSSQNPKPSITLCMCTIDDIEVYIIPVNSQYYNIIHVYVPLNAVNTIILYMQNVYRA